MLVLSLSIDFIPSKILDLINEKSLIEFELQILGNDFSLVRKDGLRAARYDLDSVTNLNINSWVFLGLRSSVYRLSTLEYGSANGISYINKKALIFLIKEWSKSIFRLSQFFL